MRPRQQSGIAETGASYREQKADAPTTPSQNQVGRDWPGSTYRAGRKNRAVEPQPGKAWAGSVRCGSATTPRAPAPDRGEWAIFTAFGVPERSSVRPVPALLGRHPGVVALHVRGDDPMNGATPARCVHARSGLRIARIRGQFPLFGLVVVNDLPDHGHGLWFVRALDGGRAGFNHLLGTVHHLLAVVYLPEILSPRLRHDDELGVDEVALGLG